MPLRLPLGPMPATTQPQQVPSRCLNKQTLTRPFSSTSSRYATEGHPKRTKFRQDMFNWLSNQGENFRTGRPKTPTYLTSFNQAGIPMRSKRPGGEGVKSKKAEDELLAPFPLNPHFKSEAVLADNVKDKIYQDVKSGTCTVREASYKYHVDMRRIGAITRLKAVEEQWVKENKPMAEPYHEAVLSMLPITTFRAIFREDHRHESINDLPVHEATHPQLFLPTSESRRFTRADAGKAFSETLLPADARIPHQEMIDLERDDDESMALMPDHKRHDIVQKRYRKLDMEQKIRAAAGETKRQDNTTTVQMGRWEWKFEDVQVDDKSTGRWAKGVGKRYGVPMQDRKKGLVKIPRSVDG